jgi:16S rRNA (cytosine967-C5)-methyltransferase
LVIRLDKARFLTTLILRQVTTIGIGFNKAYKSLVRRYGLREHEAEEYYKLLYNVVMYYYTLKFLAGYYGLKPAVQGIVDYLYKKNFTWQLVEEDIESITKGLPALTRISLRYGYPAWLVKDLAGKMPLTELETMLKALNDKKRWLRVNTSRYSIEEALSCLEESGLEFKRHEVFHEVLQLKNPFKKVGSNPCVLRGLVVPQDVSSYIVGQVAQILCSGDLLDACCAPGLKLTQVLAGSKVNRVIAVDISEKRIYSVFKLLRTLQGGSNPLVILTQGDSRKVTYSREFDSVLLDAPCSNSGTVYDDPVVKIHLSRKRIRHMHLLQYSLLTSLIKHSRLVLFTTCSIHPLEGEEVIEKLTKEHEVELIKVKYPYLESSYEGYTITRSTYRIHPHKTQGQGFYVALIRRR